jgi:hypothetical protein
VPGGSLKKKTSGTDGRVGLNALRPDSAIGAVRASTPATAKPTSHSAAAAPHSKPWPAETAKWGVTTP